MPALTSLSPSLQPSTMCSGGGGEKSCSRSGQAGGPQDPRGVWCHRVRAARPLQLDGRGGRGRKGAAEGSGLAPAGMGSAGMLCAVGLWCRMGVGSPGGVSREVRGGRVWDRTEATWWHCRLQSRDEGMWGQLVTGLLCPGWVSGARLFGSWCGLAGDVQQVDGQTEPGWRGGPWEGLCRQGRSPNLSRGWREGWGMQTVLCSSSRPSSNSREGVGWPDFLTMGCWLTVQPRDSTCSTV